MSGVSHGTAWIVNVSTRCFTRTHVTEQRRHNTTYNASACETAVYNLGHLRATRLPDHAAVCTHRLADDDERHDVATNPVRVSTSTQKTAAAIAPGRRASAGSQRSSMPRTPELQSRRGARASTGFGLERVRDQCRDQPAGSDGDDRARRAVVQALGGGATSNGRRYLCVWSTGIDHDRGTPDLSAVWLDRAVLWRYQRPPDNFMRGWRNW
jgi:hypothetical protein